MPEQAVKVKSCWDNLSRHPKSIARNQGPLPIDDIAGVFWSVHTKPLRSYLHGQTLESRLKNGDVQGVWFNPHYGTMEIKGPRGGAREEAAISPTTTPTDLGGASKA